MSEKATTRPGQAKSTRKNKPKGSAGRSTTKSTAPMATPNAALAEGSETDAPIAAGAVPSVAQDSEGAAGSDEGVWEEASADESGRAAQASADRDDDPATVDAGNAGDVKTGPPDPDDAEMVADIASRISMRRILGLEDAEDEPDSDNGTGDRATVEDGPDREAEDEAQEPAPVPMLLRRGRERYGEDLRTVASALRVNRAYLEALENGDFKRLPGRVYAIGWVRSYAEYLGLDQERVVRQFKDEYQQAGSQQELNFPITSAEAKAPGAAIIVLSGLLLVATYGAYYLLSSDDRPVEAGVVEAPERQGPDGGDANGQELVEFTPRSGERTEIAAIQPKSEPTPKPAPPPPSEPEPVAQPDRPDPPSPDESEPATTTETRLPPQPPLGPLPQPPLDPIASVTVIGPSAAPEYEAESGLTSNDEIGAGARSPGQDGATGLPDALPTGLLDSQSEHDPSIYGATNVDARIVIVAIEESWIQVNDTNDDRVLLSRVLQEGDSYRIANRPGLELITGNAGGLEVRVDGQLAPALGPRGIVRRDVKLDPTLLLNAAAHPLQSGAQESEPESAAPETPSETDTQSQ